MSLTPDFKHVEKPQIFPFCILIVPIWKYVVLKCPRCIFLTSKAEFNNSILEI